MKAKLKENFSKFENTINDIGSKLKGPLQDKADLWMGKFMYKQIATLFYWDEHVQGWVFGGKECPKCHKYNRDKFSECKNCNKPLGEDVKKYPGILELANEDKDSAITEGMMLKSYLLSKCNKSRRYDKKLKEVNKKLAAKPELLKSKFEKLKDNKFIDWLKRTGGKEDVQDDI